MIPRRHRRVHGKRARLFTVTLHSLYTTGQLLLTPELLDCVYPEPPLSPRTLFSMSVTRDPSLVIVRTHDRYRRSIIWDHTALLVRYRFTHNTRQVYIPDGHNPWVTVAVAPRGNPEQSLDVRAFMTVQKKYPDFGVIQRKAQPRLDRHAETVFLLT